MTEPTINDASGAPFRIASDKPRVSVVMTAFNDLRFIDEAVDSILQQDFPDLEVIIVDDGTGEEATFARLVARDPRIRVLVNPTNLGPAKAANRGIEAARADIIARLDSDDIAERSRIGKLVAALDADPEIGLVGSWFTTIDEAGNTKETFRIPETDLEIRWALLFYTPFCHSSVAYRRDCFEAAGRYPPIPLLSSDYYLLTGMMVHCRARNLPESLVCYRLNPRGLTATAPDAANWRARTDPIREPMWARLGVPYALRDPALAFDLHQFVSGFAIAHIEGRHAAYCTILQLLPPFLAAAKPFAREEDAAAARRLAHTMVARILSDDRQDTRVLLALCRLTWPLDWRATSAALSHRLRSVLAQRWHAQKGRLRRLWPM